MTRKETRGLKLLAAFLGICAFATASLNTGASTPDHRPEKLEAFFKSFGCPAPYHVTDYLHAADMYALDYRLLPALSVRESTCGIYARENNRWGWNSARTDFSSVGHGIHFLARKLSNGRWYRGKNLNQKLHTYNPEPHYARQVKQLMRQVDSDEAAKSPESVSQPGNAMPANPVRWWPPMRLSLLVSGRLRCNPFGGVTYHILLSESERLALLHFRQVGQ